MRDVSVHLSLINFLSVEECIINKKVNEHGSAMIRGVIKSNKEAELLRCGDSLRYASVYILDEKEESHSLFTGIIESIAIQTEAGVKKATVRLIGATRLLDLKERTRTFQNESMTYANLINKIETNYTDIKYKIGEGKDATIKEFLVQYKETDWEFIKRLASHHGGSLIPFYKTSGIKFYMGEFVSGKDVKVDPVTYKLENATDEFFLKKKNGVTGLTKEDACYYFFDSREFYELGTKVMFQNKTCYVYQVNSELSGAELIHHYSLKTDGGFKQQKIYNTKIIGASLAATILSVAGSKVKISIAVDGKQDSATAKCFTFSTVYSSPDGSGWYCMPEAGDKVRLYFPNEHEKDAYVISAIHVDSSTESNSSLSSASSNSNVSSISSGGTGSVSVASVGGVSAAMSGASKSSEKEPPRSNPDNKSLTNKYNKMIELTPTSITMTNNNGMSIILDDEEGITITSNRDILIQSDENLEIKSSNESMIVEASEFLELIQGDTKISMKEDIIVEGAMVKVQ